MESISRINRSDGEHNITPGSVSSSMPTSPTSQAGSNNESQSGKSRSVNKPAKSSSSGSSMENSSPKTKWEPDHADELILNQVHEIRRHPLFKNSAIFVPDKPPDKDYILKLLQQSISENVAKSNKKQVPLTPTPGQTENPLQSQKMQSCAHPPLKEQVCKDALTSAGHCKIKNCPSNLQHSFPK